MRYLILAVAIAGAAEMSAPARADKLCDQLKALDTAGNETPRFGSLKGETFVDPFGGKRYTTGKLEPEGLANCTIDAEPRIPQWRYECAGPSDLSVKALKAAFDKLAAGVDKCFGVKGEKTSDADYTLITYRIGKDARLGTNDGRMLEVGMSDGAMYMTFYPKPG